MLGLLAGSAAALAQPANTVPDTIAQRVAACTACHGAERSANVGYFPRIAGKPAGYLYNQLVNFRDGRRYNADMTHLVQFLSDDYLREIAGHYAALEVRYAPPQTAGATPAELERGRALALQGDAARGLPACVQCHGAALTGVAPGVPGLLGLPRLYLTTQMSAWTTGQRHAAAPDCMADVARRMTDADMRDVATWLAAQPVPGTGKPATALPAPMPMRCSAQTGVEAMR